MTAQKIVVRIELMGKCEIQVDGRPVFMKNIGLSIPWQVFCLMTTERNKWTPYDAFLSAFWPERPYDKAVNSLKNAILLLRAELCWEKGALYNSCIEYCNGGYRLGPDIEVYADYMDFYENYKQIGERRGILIHHQLPIYCRMVGLYNGGFYFVEKKKDWLYQYAHILERIYSDSICNCFRMLSATGMYNEIVAIYDDVTQKYRPCAEMTGYWYRALDMLDRKAEIPTYYAAAPERLKKIRQEELKLDREELIEILEDEDKETNENRKKLISIKEELIVSKKKKARLMDYERLKRHCAKHTSRLSIGLFTFSGTNMEENDPERIESALGVFKSIALSTLRSEDILTPYSKNQILVVLPNHSISSGVLVRDRLCRLFVEKEEGVRITADVIGI